MSEYAYTLHKHFDVPSPRKNQQQRQQQRYAWRNERNLYRRKCDLTGKEIIAMYTPDAPFPVYSVDAWYSDNWDSLEYGQDFDFSRPFFEQFFELQQKVPRIGNILSNTENCDYCNVVGDCKNCYLIFGSVHCEDCLYGSPYYSKNCIDSLVVRNSQFCYECIDSDKLYECFYCQDCTNSSNLWYCYDVTSSKDCFLCVGLRHAEYQILNQKYSADEYGKKVKELKQKSPQELRKMLLELRLKTPIKYMVGINNENVRGDHISNSKNCQNTFNSQDCENIHNSIQIIQGNNIIDSDFGEIGQFLYENSGFYKCNELFCCHWCWEVSDLYYCSICTQNTKDCFGSISLKHKQYCILNKQYSKQEYKSLLPKIIDHMKHTGEWGQFFPAKHSPFPYNKTVAQEYFPLTKDQTLQLSYTWDDTPYTAPSNTEGAIKCANSGKLFRLTPQEKEFYARYNLPAPILHPDERYFLRLSIRNPRTIHTTTCTKCDTTVETTYPSEQKVYCERCYLENTYL